MKNDEPKGGSADWESHSLKYVVSAITSAQKRQDELWTQITATRNKEGLIPVDWPVIQEYVESVRRTHSLMVDLETVGREYEARYGKARQAKRKAPEAGVVPRKPK